MKCPEMRSINLIILAFIFILSGCFAPKKEKEITPVFFSVKQFFEEESSRLNKRNLLLRKTIRIDDEVSSAIDSFPDWTTEFQSFSSLDINKSGLILDYAVDSVITEKQSHYFYENISGKQKVKSMHVFLNTEGNPELIEITASDKRFFKEETFVYSYQPNKAFAVKGVRNSIFSGSKEFEIVCEISER
jgi:hypothetical protein